VQYCLRNQANLHISDSLRIRIVAADSIRDSIRTEIDDSQVPSKKAKYSRYSSSAHYCWILVIGRPMLAAQECAMNMLSSSECQFPEQYDPQLPAVEGKVQTLRIANVTTLYICRDHVDGMA